MTGAGTVSGASARPTSGPPRPWRFPTVGRHEVAGGTVLAAHLPGQRLGSLLLVLDAGATTEPAGRDGLAWLTGQLLGEGTVGRDSYEFAVAGERLGALWYADVDWDSMRVGFDAPVDRLANAAELLAEAVRTPRFAAVDVVRVRDERLDELRVEWSQPGPRAGAGFASALFDAGSRYARPAAGDLDSVAALEPEHVRQFHANRVVPQASTLIVAGDLTVVDPLRLGATVFEGWSGTAPEAASPTVRTHAPGRRVVLVDRPGSVQSMLVIGHDGPRRLIDDYVPLTVMSTALGGVFTSRLNFELRERKGYCYGAAAGFDLRRHGGVFMARAAVHTEVTAAAAAAAVAEIERMREGGITPEELVDVRHYRTGVFPIQFQTALAVAGALADLVVHRLPDGYFDMVREQLASVDKAAVDDAARQRLRPADLLTVVVGDADRVGPDLETAGLGVVEVVHDP
ncbi:MAG TPA: pitrilysin family protein [Mycobacteriales bacterium]|nr:pitrilysin family protein [Mycobacteriales bacterium]